MNPATRPLFTIGFLLFVLCRTCFAGGWYVGHTAAGEWIQYTNVWLSAGSYRFTANAGSPAAGAAMHLEIDGVNLRPGVAVPNTGRIDSFAPAHLGSASLSQGYHTLRAVFETSGVSLDWLMLRKDTDTTTTVKASDTVLVRPSTSGMLVAPIVSFEHQSEHNSIFNANDASYILGGAVPQKATNGAAYSDYQLRSWYRVPMFEEFDRRTDRYWDIMVDQLMAARAQVPLFQCRATSDFTHDLQDRAYVRGNGAFEGRWLKKMADAVARNPQAASSLQIGMFFEDGGLADGYYSAYGSYPAWGSSALADYAMTNWLGPWFDCVPASMLYQPFPGRPIINIYTAHPTDMVQDGNMPLFLTNIRSRMIARYGLDPIFIVSPDADTNTQAAAWGVAPWYVWGQSLYNSRVFLDGSRWGFSSCGSRYRLDLTWGSDWDPVSNTGTPSGSSPGNDYYQSPLDANGNSTLQDFYSQAGTAGTRLIQEEGFYNTPEGSPVYASYASGWSYPNQHLAAMRQYADPTTDSQMFEAEDCDQYYKTTTHENLGGSYRKNWYSPTGLDVYRPLHNLNAWTNQSVGPGNLVDMSAGFFDVWALDATGGVWARGVSDTTSEPAWTSVNLNGISKFTQLAVGKHFAWALNGNAVYTCELSYSSDAWSHTTWTGISGSMAQLSVNEGDVWAVDAGGQIYFRRVNEAYYPGDTWHPVTGPGPAVNKIYAGGNGKFVWAVSGTNIYYSPVTTTNINNVSTVITNLNWTLVDNSNNLTQLSIGSEEVWGINATGSVFRRSVAAVGGWDAVDGNLKKIAIGENYAWGLSGSIPSSRRLTGFLGAPTPAIPGIPTGLAVVAGPGAGRASLAWNALLGAAGYNVKRSTVAGGPYTTVMVTTTNTAVDIGLTDGAQYYYVVTAFNGIGESTNSAPSGVLLPIPPVPDVPTGLSATAAIGQVSLNWTASLNAAGYNAKRSTVLGGPYTTVVAVSTNVALDASVTGGTRYYYVVTATNGTGESAASSPVTIVAPALLSAAQAVTASSFQTGNGPFQGNDGNLLTRWAANGAIFPSWWRVDLGTNYALGTAIIDWYGAGGRSYPYRIETSTNDINYLTVVDKTGNTSVDNSTDTFSAVARYVRITVTGGSQVGGFPSFFECKIYGSIASGISLAPINLSGVKPGNALALSWPPDHLGWRLQMQTNAPGTGLGTNWVTLPGSDLVTGTNITTNPAKGAVFYRLVYP
ncbi:MAG TPA: DUF5010 domain-containing protein [Candidatus Acidoferrales bacterium]|nr:DUF5010 domain-containing protein [Candidatus Acidoferrales bacterium]